MRLRQVCFTFQSRWGSKLTGSHWWLKKAPLAEQRHLLCRCRISTCPHSSAQSTSHSFSWVALPTFCHFHFFPPPCRPWPEEARFRRHLKALASFPSEGTMRPLRPAGFFPFLTLRLPADSVFLRVHRNSQTTADVAFLKSTYCTSHRP